jgi:hypothetical protein
MSNQVREFLYTDSQDMLVLSSTGASCYYNCCTDGSTGPGNQCKRGLRILRFLMSLCGILCAEVTVCIISSESCSLVNGAHVHSKVHNTVLSRQVEGAQLRE